MRRNLKKAWTHALRSGEYKQGTGQFTTISTHEQEPITKVLEENGLKRTITTYEVREERFDCCLGVLRDILLKDEQFKDDPLYDECRTRTSGGSGSFFNHMLVPLGFADTHEDAERVQSALVSANDDSNEGSFELIAQLINHLVLEHDDTWTPEGYEPDVVIG